MVKGSSCTPRSCAALRYSMASVLFGVCSSAAACGPAREWTAASLAEAKPVPRESSCFSCAEKAGDSRREAVSCKAFTSPHSLPKQIRRQPSCASRKTPPRAKRSAPAIAQGSGSSKTASAPHRRAISVRLHLERRAGAPRWTKSPLITTATCVAPLSRAAWISAAWPR